MSEENKQEFDEKFQAAISASLRGTKASDELRNSILGKLQAESKVELPEGVTEESVTHFQERLSEAVHQSHQEWAPEDGLVLRTEAKMGVEVEANILSERAVVALSMGEDVPPQLERFPLPAEKMKFVTSLRSEIRRSTEELKAPELTRRRVEKALKREMGQEKVSVISPRTWKRGLSALTSLAAGFAIVFITLFGSADAALASSVRSDHQNCCRKAKVLEKAPSGRLKAMMESKFGPVPVPGVDSSWSLRVSKMCMTEEGKPLVHLLYSRPSENGKTETMSFHFLPSSEVEQDKYSLTANEVKNISDSEDFPVVGWLEGDWICTACSPDLDLTSLKTVASR